MKKTTLLIIIALIAVSTVFPAKIGTLKGIFKPQMIKVFDNQLFAVEGHKVFIFSLKDLSLTKIIGKKGEGPGEFNPDPARTIIITLFPGILLGESRNKVIWFSIEGNFLKEMRKTPGILQTLPINEKFFIHKILYGPEVKNFFTVNIYDSNFNEIKELFRQKFFNYEGKVFVMPDPLNYCLCDNKIFVEKSPEGFVIDVYDFEGNPLYQIKKEYEKIQVLDSHKKEAYNDYLQIPAFRRMIRERGKSFYENFIKALDIDYPKFFPAIQDILADPVSKKIYVKTYYKKDNKEEYLAMDLKGNILKKFYLPQVIKVDFLVQMQGDKKYYTIFNDKFYYLKLNDMEGEEDEDWEVHVENLE
jgi:hypothetical protein